MASQPGPPIRLAARIVLWTGLALCLLTGLALVVSTRRSESPAFTGYTLIAPLHSRWTYLIDMQGRVVRAWESRYEAGEGAYLLEDGHLLRAGQLVGEEQLFGGAGGGGRVQEFTWDGDIVWDFKWHNEKQLSHHDIARLPGGNVLLLVWELKTADEAIATGRSPRSVDGPWLADSVIEIRPTGKTTGEVVWEWHAWDHLIQDLDPSRVNYGDVAAHPELIDINFGQDHFPTPSRDAQPGPEDALRQGNLAVLRTLGYVGSPAAKGNRGIVPEWTHVNAVAYDAELDQIMLTVRSFNEFWIIDHSTTTAEAKGHAGGRGGKGGDLLYRWGNPRAYRAGTTDDQRLFAPHHAHWIPRDCPGAGHVLVFNNGVGRSGGPFSSVDELVLPIDARGRYLREPGSAYEPIGPAWSYTAPRTTDFYAALMSGAQRLPNGNTLICDSMRRIIFEVTRFGDVAWAYRYTGSFKLEEVGFHPAPDGPEEPHPPGRVLASSTMDQLEMSPGQKKEIEQVQQEVDSRLDRILTAEQKERLRAMSGGASLPGRILSSSREVLLKPTGEQKRQLADLQKAVDTKLDRLLDARQKALFQKIRGDPGRGGPPRLPDSLPDQPSKPDSSRPSSGGRSFKNPIFRAYRYGRDYAGLAGRELKPGAPLERLEAKESKKK
jgi:Arylsulfotransferase (ASST)